MAKREPLLDTEWLLGSPERSGPWWRSFLQQAGVLLFLVAIGVGMWPMLSKSWLENELLDQYRNGNSAHARNEAMISLAELLPKSLPVVVAGLSKPDREEAHLAFQALDYYVGQLTTLPIEQRRGYFAELIHALEEAVPGLSRESSLLATALAARVNAVQQSDQHPGTLVTLAACQRICQSQPSRTPATLASTATLADSRETVSTHHLPSITASLSDRLSDEQPDPPQAPLPEVATVDNAAVPVYMALKSNDETEAEPPAFDNSTPSNSTASSGQLRQKLLRANRFVPVTGNLSIPLQANSLSALETTAKTSANESSESVVKSSAGTTRLGNSEEEVIGIDRQTTEYLLNLLGSVTPRLASAAFHELRTRLSKKELELAVELTQGTSQQRMLAMERLIKDADINPIPWLAWMGREADRDVRFKAVSLLGSINNEDARLKLRLMHSRERDVEISRHIQSALLASGSVKPHIQ